MTLPEKMKKFELVRPGYVRFSESNLPKMGPDDVLIKVDYAGLCRTMVTLVDGGADVRYPITLGDEVAGTVVDSGENVHSGRGMVDWLEGDAVIVPPTWAKCIDLDNDGNVYHIDREKSCVACLEDDNARCKSQYSLAHNVQGSFAEYMVVHRKAVFGYDRDKLEPDKACIIGDMLGTSYNAVFNVAKIQKGQNVAIIGSGGQGMGAIANCKLAGADKIVAVDIDDSKLAAAREIGATSTINSKTVKKASDAIKKELNYNVHAVIDCIGVPETIRTGYDAVSTRGILTLVGFLKEDVSLPLYETMAKGKKIDGVWSGQLQDYRKVIGAAEDGKYNFDAMIGTVFDFEQTGKAINALRANKVFRKAVIRVNKDLPVTRENRFS